MRAAGEGLDLGKDPASSLACACGCGAPLAPKRYRSIKYSGPQQRRFVIGHNNRGRMIGTIESRSRGGAAAAQRLNTRTIVPAEPVQRLMRVRYGSDAERALVQGLGVTRQQASRLMHQERMRRSSAQRILALLGGLGRTPSLTQRRLTDRRDRAARREQEAKDRARQRVS